MAHHPWHCHECSRANRFENAECYWCGGTEKVDLHPVDVPNIRQNTPGIEALEAEIAAEEAARQTDIAFEEQLNNLLAAYYREKAERSEQPPTGWGVAENRTTHE